MGPPVRSVHGAVEEERLVRPLAAGLPGPADWEELLGKPKGPPKIGCVVLDIYIYMRNIYIYIYTCIHVYQILGRASW